MFIEIIDRFVIVFLIATARVVASETSSTGLMSSNTPSSSLRIVIVPGNGGRAYPAPLSGNFYASLAKECEASNLFPGGVVATSMPDPRRARRQIWIPHLTDVVKVDRSTIVVGHSSGAEAAMRLAEKVRLKGIVLVAACHTDLGHEGERQAGWYPPSGGEWDWKAIKANVEWIVQFHSTDDPFIDVSEARHVAKQLESEYYEMKGKSHFFEPFEEAFLKIKEKIITKQSKSEL